MNMETYKQVEAHCFIQVYKYSYVWGKKKYFLKTLFNNSVNRLMLFFLILPDSRWQYFPLPFSHCKSMIWLLTWCCLQDILIINTNQLSWISYWDDVHFHRVLQADSSQALVKFEDTGMQHQNVHLNCKHLPYLFLFLADELVARCLSKTQAYVQMWIIFPCCQGRGLKTALRPYHVFI